MTNLSVIVTLIFLVVFLSFVQCKNRRTSLLENNSGHLNLPQPRLEAFYPRGIKVSMPDIEGMQLFAFHGKINSPIHHLESGNLSKDVLQPINGEWIFEDDQIQLRLGDVVNYWIFIQINGMGRRLDNLSTVIKDLLPSQKTDTKYASQDEHQVMQYGLLLNQYGDSSSCGSQNNHQKQVSPTTSRNNYGCNTNELRTISTQLNVTLMQLGTLNDLIAPLRSQVDSLTELLQELIKDKDIGTQLLLIGQEPPGKNLLEAIKQLVVEKLDLIDLEERIEQAHRSNDGILFEVSSPIDKKRILFRAKNRLQNSNYDILDPQDYKQRKFPIISLSMIRFGDDVTSQQTTERSVVNRYQSESNQGLQFTNRNNMRSKTSNSGNQESIGRQENNSGCENENSRRSESRNEVSVRGRVESSRHVTTDGETSFSMKYDAVTEKAASSQQPEIENEHILRIRPYSRQEYVPTESGQVTSRREEESNHETTQDDLRSFNRRSQIASQQNIYRQKLLFR